MTLQTKKTKISTLLLTTQTKVTKISIEQHQQFSDDHFKLGKRKKTVKLGAIFNVFDINSPSLATSLEKGRVLPFGSPTFAIIHMIKSCNKVVI